MSRKTTAPLASSPIETPILKSLQGATKSRRNVGVDGGWFEVRFTFAGVAYRAQALTFTEPSDYGIGRGKVSKLSISPLTAPRGTELYNYDRGLDFDRAPAGLVDALVAYLEGR